MQAGAIGLTTLLVAVVLLAAVPAQSPGRPGGRQEAERLGKVALAAIARQDYATALNFIEKAIDAAPDWHSLWYKRAHIHYLRGDLDAAIANCNKAIALAPAPFIRAMELRAVIYRTKGDLDRACAEIKAALEVAPNDHDLQMNLGTILLGRKEWKEAIRAFTPVCTQYPKSYFARLNRGIAYCQDGEFAKGFADFNEAERISPKDIQVSIQRALALYDKREPDASLDICTKVLQTKANKGEERGYAAVAYTRGMILRDRRNSKAAIEDFTLAIRFFPRHFLARLRRGELYLAQEKYEDAREDLSQCITLRPTDPQAYELRSQLYDALGDRAKAREDAAKAKALRHSI